jgi:hypothetical protein
LSKRDHTDPVGHQDPAYALRKALHFLGQQPPAALGLESLWEWALEQWDSVQIPRQKEIMAVRV